MEELKFEQRAFLALYKRFYKRLYPAKVKNNTDAHIKAQKMGYIFSLYSIDIGEYGYMWDTYGPCSSALQYELKYLDENPMLVQKFYNKFPEDTALFTPDGDLSGLYTTTQGAQIDQLSAKLKIGDHSGDMKDWSERLGSLAYICRSRMPGASFNVIHEKLSSIKPYFNDKEKNLQAWKALRAAKII